MRHVLLWRSITHAGTHMATHYVWSQQEHS